jgi:hypothetical protein
MAGWIIAYEHYAEHNSGGVTGRAQEGVNEHEVPVMSSVERSVFKLGWNFSLVLLHAVIPDPGHPQVEK